MSSKKTIYKKQIVRKKMASIVTYGFLFLLSTIAYYFVNTSNAQNVTRIAVSVIDEEANIDIVNYELKAAEEDNNYSVKFSAFQNGFKVKKYILATEEEFETLKKQYDLEKSEKEEIEPIENIEEEEKTSSEEINTENVEDEDTTLLESEIVLDENNKENIENESQENDINGLNQQELDEEKIEIEPDCELKLTQEQLESKKIYLIAQYDYKETGNEKLYNKIISENTEKNIVSVLGYMPKDSEILVKNIETEEIENKIKENFEDVNRDIKLSIAYDIKIIVDGKEYEPEDFDENVIVEITGIDQKNINIWHVKNDNTIEVIELEKKDDKIEFNTNSFSIYGVEELEEEPKEDGEGEVSGITRGGALKAPARDLPDSTLVIDDYLSDYYYYMGQNYTSNISGTNSNTYSSSNLIRVTLNYYGFANGETDYNKKGRISIDETQDIVQNIRCTPVSNGSITIELMENPFMDKPTGFGFGGWTPSIGTVTTDTKTLTQTLEAPANGEVTINLYAKWEEASVVYVNPSTGNDTFNDGLTESTPFGSWGAAFSYLADASHNKNDREKNIIVLTGNIDSSINYSRPITATETSTADVTYTPYTTITSGETYILSTGTGNNSNAISVNGNSITNTQIRTSIIPPETARWVVTQSGNGYTIRNVSTGRYLAYSNGLTTQQNAFTWNYNNRRFSATVSGWIGSTTYYIRYNNGWTTSTNQNQRITV